MAAITQLYAGGVLAFLLVLSRIIYLRYFHPLAKIPGPFLASVTDLYRFYYDYINHGSYYLQFEMFQAKYGPVIRIAPNEVLLTDPENYDKIYNMNTKFYKDPTFYTRAGAATALFSITSNEEHRQYRAIFNPFFSRRSVLEQEHVVQNKVAKLMARVEADSERGVRTDIAMGFRAVSVDVISEYMFGVSWNSLDRDDLGGWFNTLARTIVPMMYVFQIAPVLQAPMQAMPPWLAKMANPIVSGMMDMLEVIKKDVERVVDEVNNGVEPERGTIYHTIMNPSAPKTEDYQTPSIQHMVDEGFGFLGAASETAGNAMTMCAFHALRDKTVHAKLHKELVDAFPDPTKMSFLTLEKLPYLTGVIKEGTRLSYGVLHPLPRVVPEVTVFNGHVLEKGTTVSMSAWLMHRDPTAFPNPASFKPERWLGPDKSLQEKYFVPFSRGGRICIGQPLAMCELYVAVGHFFRRFGPGDLEPLSVGPEDFEFEDYFGAFRRTGARNFTVLRAARR